MSPSALLSRPAELLTRTEPFDPEVLAHTKLDPTTVSSVELPAGGELFNLVCAHIAKAPAVRSFTFDIGCDKSGCDTTRVAAKNLGLGLFEFSFDGEPMWALHQTLGEVVGSDCGATLLRNLVLISPNSIDVIEQFCNKLISENDVTKGTSFTIYRFMVRHQYWHRCETVTARTMDSVVLPKALKQRVVDDLDDFVEPVTKEWYTKHGIPYKRSYLLYGSPGAGKTSLIQAIAGRYSRNVCYLSPSHPDMTDDALKSAVQRVPARSIIVLEDVDALFGSDGRHKNQGDKSALTFSGVLNALDGIGGADGQIFVLTTNHRERLDPALIRSGRVDCHVEFTDATEEQMSALFCAFYPAAEPALGEKFAASLTKLLDGKRTVSMAALQSFFVGCRKKTAEEAAAGAARVIEEADASSNAEKEDKKEEEEKKEGKKEEGGEADGKEDGQEEGQEEDKAAKKKGKKGSREVHVHVHVD